MSPFCVIMSVRNPGLQGELVAYGKLEHAVLCIAVFPDLGESLVVAGVHHNVVKLV